MQPESNNSVKFIRMSSGEDLLTEVIDKRDGDKKYMVFINPMKLMYMMGKKPGALGISLIQWVFPNICEKQEFLIDPQNITTISSASAQISDYYWNSLGLVDKAQVTDGDQEDSGEPGELELLNDVLKNMKINQKRTYH